MLAIFPSLSMQEMLVLLVIGLLIYGRNLPEAGRTLGRMTAHLRRGFNEFRDQMNRDADVGEMKRTLQSTRDQLRQAATVKRAVSSPKAALADLTNAALSSPLPREEAVSDAAAELPPDGANGTGGRDRDQTD